jgi:hypothetical protein
MKSWLPIYGLAVSCIIILCYLYFAKRYVEPFASSVPVSNISKPTDEIFLMARQNPIETFTSYKATNWYRYTQDGFTYEDAQKVCESVDATLADLTVPTNASNLSLQVALDLSGHWCAAGWTKGSSTIAYFPVNDTSSVNKCIPTVDDINVITSTNCAADPAPGKFCVPNVRGFGKYKPSNGKAYAICMGPKPPNPTALVNYFNRLSYSMYSDELMVYLTTGQDSTNVYVSDIFPVQFTPSQAFNALVNTSFNPQDARRWLVRNYQVVANVLTAPSNESVAINEPKLLLKAPDNEATRTAWSNSSVEQSCVTLEAVYTEMNTQLKTLTELFSDLSGVVQKMIIAKGENALLQTTVTKVCIEASSDKVKSSACNRLLTLDYDLFYRNTSNDPYRQTNLITNLETLNLALRVRECEIQQALGSLQQILTVFKTNSRCATTLANLKTKYKDNMVPRISIPAGSIIQSNGSLKNSRGAVVAPPNTVALSGQIVAGSIVQGDGSIKTSNLGSTIAPPGTVLLTGEKQISCNVLFNNDGTVWDGTGSTPTDGAAPNTAFKIGRDIPYNSVDSLKLKLEEISPFFTGPQYAALANTVINQLSIMIRTPLPTEYSFVGQITKAVNDALNLITTTVVKM